MNQKKHTVRTIQKMRDNAEIITMLTAYDYPTAKQINDAGIDMILVGDSCAMVVHGHPNTLNATMDMMVLHCTAVARACDRTMVVADMPFGSFQYGIEETMRNAARFVTDAKVDAVKFEATPSHIEKTRAIVEMGIAVVGHVGLPRATAAQCSTIISMVAVRVLGCPWTTMAQESPTRIISIPASLICLAVG